MFFSLEKINLSNVLLIERKVSVVYMLFWITVICCNKLIEIQRM